MFSSVTRPGRYLDHETNLRRTRSARLRFLLCFPDLYDIGMSNLGIRILYHVLNRQEGMLADLAFAPWADMQEFMRRERIPLGGTGTGLPAKDFDVVGFSLQHELQYANVLAMLDLAGIPVVAAERGDGDPIVVAGGPCAFNPGPMSDFIDAFVIGDGETVIVEISSVLARAKERGQARAARLGALAGVSGVYLPALDGRQAAEPVARRVEPALRDEDFPMPPLVPIIPITHDRLTLEIMRGCTRGCRFCSAGMLCRPVRERGVDSVVRLAQEGIEASGWEEVSLVSLSTSDYADLEHLVSKLAGVLEQRRVSISLPSMRPGTFSREVARVIARTRKTGLTFAPEAGSEKLRNRVNKDVNEQELYSTIETAFRSGWDSVKLYFMIGLPGEDDGDIEGLIRMGKSVGAICRGFGKRRYVTLSLSPFVPRPHTPLQWEAQCMPEEVLRRVNLIRKNLPDKRIRLKWRDPSMSLAEGLLARGDRRFGRVIAAAWKAGAGFDSWTDRFDFGLWSRCFQSEGIDVVRATGAREAGEALPWSHIAGGVSADFLKREAEKAHAGQLTPDCRSGACSDCGACPGPDRPGAQGLRSPALDRVDPGGGLSGQAPVPAQPGTAGRTWSATKVFKAPLRLRVRYAKSDEIRFTSHLDVTRCIQRGLRRSGLALCYSEGFSPHPRMSFGPPLPLGVAGKAEYFDVFVEAKPADGWIERVNCALPQGIRVAEARVVPGQGPSLVAMLNAGEYRMTVYECGLEEGLALLGSLKHAFGEAGVSKIGHEVSGGEFRIEMLARLKVDSGASEKVIDKVLRPEKAFKLTRLGLYLEKDRTYYTPFGELRKENK
jgi:radical SAM family uncharacterized protein